MTLSGKKALVTGAAGGIGQAIVRALTDAGAALASDQSAFMTGQSMTVDGGLVAASPLQPGLF